MCVCIFIHQRIESLNESNLYKKEMNESHSHEYSSKKQKKNLLNQSLERLLSS